MVGRSRCRTAPASRVAHPVSGSHRIDPAQQMARWDTPFEIEKVKQPALIAALPTHHDPTSSLKPSTKRNHDSPIHSTLFQHYRPKADIQRFCSSRRGLPWLFDPTRPETFRRKLLAGRG